MTSPFILMIDDQYASNSAARESLKTCFALREASDPGATDRLGTVRFCSGLKEGKFSPDASIEEVETMWSNNARWALVVVDYNFVERGGRNIHGARSIVQAIKSQVERGKDVPIVLFSSSDPKQVEAEVRDGVAFLQKPKLGQRTAETEVGLVTKLHRILLQHGLCPDEGVRFVDDAGKVRSLNDSTRKVMMGGSLEFLKTLREARGALLKQRFPALLIEGPEGSGKDELVRYVHDWGRALAVGRAVTAEGQKPVSFRVGEMTESEIDRVSDQLRQKLEEARQGTLHVDPIECLPAPMQRFFARWIEEHTDGTAEGGASAPFQMVFTSSQPMQELLEGRQIVSSLADQLHVIGVPSVSDRNDAVEVLEYFLKDVWSARPQPSDESKDPPTLNRQAKEVVAGVKNWPGNIRQIRRVAAMLMARNEFRRLITADEVRTCIVQTSSFRGRAPRRGVRGLIDRMAAHAVGEDERLDGVLKDFREAGAHLVKQIIVKEARTQSYNIQGVARDLLDERTLTANQPAHRLRKWVNFFVGSVDTGDRELDDRLSTEGDKTGDEKIDDIPPAEAKKPRRAKGRIT